MRLLQTSILLAAFLVASSVRLQGQTAFEILKSKSGAEAASLGGASSATLESIEGALHNPATLGSFRPDWEVVGALDPYLSATMAHAVVAKNFGSVTLAVSGVGLFYEGIQGYVAYSGDSGKPLAAGDFVLGASAAWSAGTVLGLPFMLDLGLSLRYAHQILDTDYLSALAGDAGMILGFRNVFGEDDLSLGLYGKNLGVALVGPEAAAPPLSFSAGAAYRFHPKKWLVGFKVLGDFSLDPREGAGVNVGVGLELFHILWLRTGYAFANEVGGPTFGAGARLPLRGATLVLDYAAIPFGVLGVRQSLQLAGC